MELIYCWIDNFRNFFRQPIRFNDRFAVEYNPNMNELTLIENRESSIHKCSQVISISAIVGKNGVGKSNILDLIGSRKYDRRVQYKSSNNINKNMDAYFIVYHLGENEFIIEGSFLPTINGMEPQNSNEIVGWYSIKFNLTSGYQEPWDRYLASENMILLFRDKYNGNNFSHRSLAENLDYNQLVRRSLIEFKPRTHMSIIKMLIQQLNTKNRTLFNDPNYFMHITFNDFHIENFRLEEDLSFLPESNILTQVLSSFTCYFYQTLQNSSNNRDSRSFGEIAKESFERNRDEESYYKFYLDIIKMISKELMENNLYKFNEKAFEEQYEKLYYALSEDQHIEFEKGDQEYEYIDSSIKILIGENTDESIFTELVEATLDSQRTADKNEIGNLFQDFFDYTIKYLSDGEQAFLELFSSVYEQVAEIVPEYDNYIILLDEPEQRMHPELARRLIMLLNQFILDLDNERKLTIQFIVTTHSPFILTDILSGNVIFLKRDIGGKTQVERKQFNSFAGNIHKLLIENFFMESTIGEYATSKIKEVIFGLEAEKSLSEETISYYNSLITEIGEPIIQNRIRKMFNQRLNKEGKELISDYKKTDHENYKRLDKLITKQLKELQEMQRIMRSGFNDSY